MPNLNQAKKALRKSKKRALHNKSIKIEIKDLTKKTKKAITAKSAEQAYELLKNSIKKIDKAAKKGIIHKNTAARKKSRLTKKVNSIKSVK